MAERWSAGSREGDLVRLFGEAGLTEVLGGELSVTVPLASFEDWWAPYLEPAGSVGDYMATRDARAGRPSCGALPVAAAATGRSR